MCDPVTSKLPAPRRARRSCLRDGVVPSPQSIVALKSAMVAPGIGVGEHGDRAAEKRSAELWNREDGRLIRS